MALRLVVYGAIIILGLMIIYAGARLIASNRSDPMPPGQPGDVEQEQVSPVSGIVFILMGVLMIAMAAGMIAQAEHEVMTAVSPTSYLKLDTPPPAAEAPPESRPER